MFDLFGGAGGDRTRDLLTASVKPRDLSTPERLSEILLMRVTESACSSQVCSGSALACSDLGTLPPSLPPDTPGSPQNQDPRSALPFMRINSRVPALSDTFYFRSHTPGPKIFSGPLKASLCETAGIFPDFSETLFTETPRPEIAFKRSQTRTPPHPPACTIWKAQRGSHGGKQTIQGCSW